MLINASGCSPEADRGLRAAPHKALNRTRGETEPTRIQPSDGTEMSRRRRETPSIRRRTAKYDPDLLMSSVTSKLHRRRRTCRSRAHTPGACPVACGGRGWTARHHQPAGCLRRSRTALSERREEDAGIGIMICLAPALPGSQQTVTVTSEDPVLRSDLGKLHGTWDCDGGRVP